MCLTFQTIIQELLSKNSYINAIVVNYYNKCPFEINSKYERHYHECFVILYYSVNFSQFKRNAVVN